MDQIRRNILLGAGGALGGAALAAPGALAAARNEVLLLSTYVAGTAYHQTSEASALRPGGSVTLRREPRNDYDPRAIAVHARSGAKLGYLPRVDNPALANLMDKGFQVTARIQQVVPDRRRSDIRLEIFLTV